METELMCGGPFQDFMTGTILPITGIATITTALLIALGYMASRFTSNPKLSLWAKTEIIQLGISLFSVIIIMTTIPSFCSINIGDIADVLDVPSPGSANIFEAAGLFLHDALEYSHDAMVVSRYQLEAYTVLSYYSGFICDFNIGRIGLGCWFGWGGENMQPYGGYGAKISALNIVFNSLIVTYFTALSYAFVLLFVYKGFVFFFLPVGLFVRCLPYMRSLGGILIAVALSFLIVYPTVLSVFYLMGDVLFAEPSPPADVTDSSTFDDAEASLVKTDAEYLAISMLGEDEVENIYLGVGNCITCSTHSLGDAPYALEFAAHAYVGSGFFPTVALLATIASVVYLSRLYGDEIDMSRLVQMV